MHPGYIHLPKQILKCVQSKYWQRSVEARHCMYLKRHGTERQIARLREKAQEHTAHYLCTQERHSALYAKIVRRRAQARTRAPSMRAARASSRTLRFLHTHACERLQWLQVLYTEFF